MLKMVRKVSGLLTAKLYGGITDTSEADSAFATDALPLQGQIPTENLSQVLMSEQVCRPCCKGLQVQGKWLNSAPGSGGGL